MARGSNGLMAPGMAESGPVGPPTVQPPHSMFHPVPTRPVFTPWVVDEPEAVATPAVARRSTILAAQRPAMPSAEPTAQPQVAEPAVPRLMPAPSVRLDPEEKPGDPSAPAPNGTSVSAVRSTAAGWHAAGE